MEIVNLLISVLGILISAFVAYHIYFLSKKLTFRNKINHQLYIREQIQVLQKRIWYENKRNRVYLVNIDKFEQYPEHLESHISGGLKGCHLGGVVIERSVSQEVDLEDGTKGEAVKFGIIPYEWIEEININGDDANNSALIYCHFNNKNKTKNKKSENISNTPFKHYEWYLINKKYKEGVSQPWEYYSYSIELL